MRAMDNGSYLYGNPYYGSFPTHQWNRSGSNETTALLDAIKRKAKTIHLYHRLSEKAADQQEQAVILQALNEERTHLQHFTELYTRLSGQLPDYETEKITFHSYQDGVRKASEIEAENYEAMRFYYYRSPQSSTGHAFLRACQDEIRHVEQAGQLAANGDIRQETTDFGGEPYVVDIEDATLNNDTFRTAIWTGENFQVTVMSIDVGDDIGLEVHPNEDQFLRLEQGEGRVQMGDTKDNLDFEAYVEDDYAIMVPAGKWHNITNIGQTPMKLYVIYAPPEHPFGTVHETKADALAAEEG
ncbi:cupin domain-containing protein [Thalassobacillus devorans]|uniref:cupin domain-containing protein n=1 Tax=Thalassobacillus devorans TaxID=279813 RepID=UPI001594C3B4|nr:cupin domain-containing protein [Thalassobacillus devorans]